MSGRVWKYEINAPDKNGETLVTLPATATPLSVGFQGEGDETAMVLWCLIVGDPWDFEEDLQRRKLIVMNTGTLANEFPPDARFLGTLTTDNNIVWHVWDAGT